MISDHSDIHVPYDWSVPSGMTPAACPGTPALATALVLTNAPTVPYGKRDGTTGACGVSAPITPTISRWRRPMPGSRRESGDLHHGQFAPDVRLSRLATSSPGHHGRAAAVAVPSTGKLPTQPGRLPG
jgi:hypothetical protein